MSTRRRLLGIEDGDEKVVDIVTLIPNFKRTIVDTDGRTFLDNYDFSSRDQDSIVIPARSLSIILGVDAFVDCNHVLSRIELNRLKEENPETINIILNVVKYLREYVLTEEEISMEVLDVRVALVDQDIRTMCRRLSEDVRAWTGTHVPIRYESSEIRLGIHSVDIKRALDENGQETTRGPEYIGRVTLYMYSTSNPNLSLIFT